MNQQKVIIKKGTVTKWRLLWILIAAAWIFVFLKLIIGALFEKNTSLVAAFSVTNPEVVSATVEVAAKYTGEAFPDETKMRRLLEEVADSIGLVIDGEPELSESVQRTELSFFKDALAADTELKVIRLLPEKTAEETGETYLYAKICLNQSLDTVLAYKTLLEKTMEELPCEEISTTIQLVGDYAGYLPMERRDEITEKILDALGAEVVYEYREQELYTVYAYTASLENFITVENKKINVHIAMSLNEDHYRTTLYLASPILPDTW